MPQTAGNHTALDPITHYILTPVALITLGLTINLAAHTHPLDFLHIWLVVLAAAFMLLNMKTRLYALRLQDRIIRLEERQRLATLLPAADVPRTASLTTSQLIALRFASDAELPALALRAAAANLPQKEIKSLIATWRPDPARV